MTAGRLPAGFEALEPFAEQWAAPDTDARMTLRVGSDRGAQQAFYAAAQPLLGRALEHLDRVPIAQLDNADQRLLDLMMTLAHISLAIEKQQDAEPHHARAQQRFTFERSTQDFAGPHPTPSGTA